VHPHQLPLWPALAQAREAVDWRVHARPCTLDAGAAFVKARAVKPSTARHYADTFRTLAAWSPTLPTTAIEIEQFLAAVRVAPTTRDGYYRDLRAFYRWASARLVDVPDAAAGVARPRFNTPLPAILSNDDIKKLLRIKNRRDRALIAFLLDTGARLHEAAGVRRSDITDNTTADGRTTYTVRLRGSADARGDWRSKTGERLVPLSRPAAQLLTGVGQGDTIWTAEAINRYSAGHAGEPLTAYGLQAAVNRITRNALGRKYGPHALRHTMATMYLRAGGDLESLRRIMGHAKIETTLIYLHLVAEDLAAKHDAFSPIARALR
jgi:site-specific recombinase XerD